MDVGLSKKTNVAMVSVTGITTIVSVVGPSIATANVYAGTVLGLMGLLAIVGVAMVQLKIQGDLDRKELG